MEDEFTAKMHSEFELSPEQERKHIAWTVLDVACHCLENDDFDLAYICQSYAMSPSEVNRYFQSWIVATRGSKGREKINRIQKELNKLINK